MRLQTSTIIIAQIFRKVTLLCLKERSENSNFEFIEIIRDELIIFKKKSIFDMHIIILLLNSY